MTPPLAALLLAAALGGPQVDPEARVSLDLKDAPVVDIVRLLADVAGFQAVLDSGITCKLTLKLTEVRWPVALDMALRSCGLGRDEEGGVLRIAPVERLRQQAADQRRLAEERAKGGPLRASTFRLSYARAEQMAPLLKRWLSPRGEVVFDARTNTLIILD
jgi:type IV pilus assembly protein PilQ